MAKYIKLFNAHQEYETYINGGGVALPNVSHCVQENEVHYNEEQRIIVKFNVTSTDTPTKLTYNATSLAKISKIEIDGVILDPIAETYTFDTVGEHTVKYTMVNPSEIGFNLFRRCDGINEVRIPKNIKSIGTNAFTNCTNLTKINIPNSITSIGTNAFTNCTSLPVENNIRYADTYAVVAVDNTLTTYTIKQGTKFIGNGCFSGNTNLETISIPNAVTVIGNYAFKDCTSLSNIVIPNSVTTINVAAFMDCASLTSINIPNSVTTIDSSAFSDCTGLTSITIGSGVTSISSQAFNRCTSLETITSLATTAPIIHDYTFQEVKTEGTLYVPQGSTGYDVWMGTENYYLGKYGWTKVEQ